VYLTPQVRGFSFEFCSGGGARKTTSCPYQMVETVWCICVDTIPQRDRQIDRWTELLKRYHVLIVLHSDMQSEAMKSVKLWTAGKFSPFLCISGWTVQWEMRGRAGHTWACHVWSSLHETTPSQHRGSARLMLGAWPSSTMNLSNTRSLTQLLFHLYHLCNTQHTSI